MEVDEDGMSDVPGKATPEKADHSNGAEISETEEFGSPKVPSAFLADAMRRRSSLPVSTEALPRSYARSNLRLTVGMISKSI